jgi:hypothetical protein
LVASKLAAITFLPPAIVEAEHELIQEVAAVWIFAALVVAAVVDPCHRVIWLTD